ncbi:hypothetical protein ABQE93_07720 [Mycolicibacterium sp. XJ662]
MNTVQEINQKVQEQTMEAVRKTQDATVDAVTAWTETATKVTPQLADFAKGYEIPGMNEVTKQLPSVGEIIDSNFDFAQQVLTSQREFAHRIVEATRKAAK